MKGEFGVFDGVELLGTFDNDVDADEWRSDALQLNLHECVRQSPYDDLQVYGLPDDWDPARYDLMFRLLRGLQVSRRTDRSIERCLRRMSLAQKERAEGRHATA